MPASVGRHAVARFGNFEADLGAGELRKAGVRIKLHDQRVRVLVMLCCWTGREGPLMPWKMGSARSQRNFSFRTMMVIMTGNTPSLKASTRPSVIFDLPPFKPVYT